MASHTTTSNFITDNYLLALLPIYHVDFNCSCLGGHSNIYIYMLLNASIGLLITKNTLGFYKVYSGLENEPLFSSTRKCQGLPNIR